jgi:hypothetical protein
MSTTAASRKQAATCVSPGAVVRSICTVCTQVPERTLCAFRELRFWFHKLGQWWVELRAP